LLRRKTPEAQDIMLAEREGVLRRYLPNAHDAKSVHLCEGNGCSSKILPPALPTIKILSGISVYGDLESLV
jgi:hypothetical protein